MTITGYKQRLATRAALDYKMVDLIGASVGRLMSKSAKFPTAEEAYPGLIEPRRPDEIEELQIRKTKDWLMRYAEANNAKHRGNQ